jgi:CRP-like cAMP-binding protein
MGPHITESAYEGGNVILDRLTADERQALLPDLTVFFEEEGSVLRARDQPIEAVHFPIDAVYSVVVELGPGQMYEVDLIGRASAVGAELALGAHVASRTVLCQGSGYVAQLPSAQFMTALDRSRTFLMDVRESLRRQWFASQQTVACNFAHTLEQRTARWILLTQDQVGREQFTLRAEFLSIMLGLTEPQVREPLHLLIELGCIRYEGEDLTVVSRSALEDYVCECYQRQLTAPFITLDRMP